MCSMQAPIVTTHRDLAAWQEATTRVEMAYRNTLSFPREEA